MSYQTELAEKKFQGNVVVRFVGQYFAIRTPDSGLSIPTDQEKTIRGLVLNPTSVDLKRVNQTIASYSFKLIDKNLIVTNYVRDRADALVNQEVEIWIGRSGVNMDFSEYFKLPIVRIKKVTHNGNEYSFSCTESTDRMRKPVFDLNAKTDAAVSNATTTFTLQTDITDWPSSGYAKINAEIFSYASKNNALKQISGILRGLKNTTAASHDRGSTVSQVYEVTDNPLNILLKLLISNGGGGTYDTYIDGLGIPNALIDITEIENLRDTIFDTQQYNFLLYGITNTLTFIEKEILQPCNLRFKVSENSKISLALLDQSIFGEAPESIDESTISTYPQWDVDDNKIVNVLQVEYDYHEGNRAYSEQIEYRNDQSILDFGERDPYKLSFKGIRASLNGAAIVQDNAQRFLERFGTPNPEISFKTHVAKHLTNIGDKVLVSSSQIPTAAGTLNFATELEVISRGINFETGDVNFKLAFTSYSGIRGCYIAPSDSILTVVNQKTIILPAGRGDCYAVGWRMVLWNNTTKSYTADPYNEIESIVGDTITFVNNFTTTLTAGTHRIKFVDYDDATQDQKRYCYVSDSGANFNDGASTYRILF